MSNRKFTLQYEIIVSFKKPIQKDTKTLEADSIEAIAEAIKNLRQTQENVAIKNIHANNDSLLTNDEAKYILKIIFSCLSTFNFFIDETYFTHLITQSEELADFCLTEKELREHLESTIKKPDEQLFVNGCAAKATQLFLENLNKLHPNQKGRAGELMIYQLIWAHPGGITDAKKLYHFLREQTGIHTAAISIGNQGELSIKHMEEKNEQKDEGDRITLLKTQLGLFKGLDTHKIIQENEFDSHIQPGESFLLVTLTGDLPHLLYVTKTQDHKYEAIDPDDGKKTCYNNATDLMKAQKITLGLYKLQNPPEISLTANATRLLSID